MKDRVMDLAEWALTIGLAAAAITVFILVVAVCLVGIVTACMNGMFINVAVFLFVLVFSIILGSIIWEEW